VLLFAGGATTGGDPQGLSFLAVSPSKRLTEAATKEEGAGASPLDDTAGKAGAASAISFVFRYVFMGFFRSS
jgi:hypothetical protein